MTVELNGGIRVSDLALRWVLGFEERWRQAGGQGVCLEVREGLIYPSMPDLLTDEDKAILKAHRWHVLEILNYIVPDAEVPTP